MPASAAGSAVYPVRPSGRLYRAELNLGLRHLRRIGQEDKALAPCVALPQARRVGDMNTDMNSMILQSEVHYRAERAYKGIARRRRLQQIKKYTLRKLG